MRDAWGVGAPCVGALVRRCVGELVCVRPRELPRVVVGLRVGSRADQGGAWSSGLGLGAWGLGLWFVRRRACVVGRLDGRRARVSGQANGSDIWQWQYSDVWHQQ